MAYSIFGFNIYAWPAN